MFVYYDFVDLMKVTCRRRSPIIVVKKKWQRPISGKSVSLQ
jgi:hypothetical protein